MAETLFLRGKFIKIWSHMCKTWNNARDTLIAVEDIKRIKACKIHIQDKSGKETGTRISLVVSAIGRLNDSEDSVDCYELTDPIPVIAEAIHRDPDELSALLLELELQE